MDYYYKVLKGHVFPWHKIEDYVNAENFPFFSTMVFIITTVALGRRRMAAVAACAHSLSCSHRAARVAHISGSARRQPI